MTSGQGVREWKEDEKRWFSRLKNNFKILSHVGNFIFLKILIFYLLLILMYFNILNFTAVEMF
jgi:hypothetical protein